jgi:uncharacterized membrane protein
LLPGTDLFSDSGAEIESESGSNTVSPRSGSGLVRSDSTNSLNSMGSVQEVQVPKSKNPRSRVALDYGSEFMSERQKREKDREAAMAVDLDSLENDLKVMEFCFCFCLCFVFSFILFLIVGILFCFCFCLCSVFSFILFLIVGILFCFFFDHIRFYYYFVFNSHVCDCLRLFHKYFVLQRFYIYRDIHYWLTH